MQRLWAWISTACWSAEPDTGEQAMEICEALVRSGAIDAIVVDSVAAMVPHPQDRGRDG